MIDSRTTTFRRNSYLLPLLTTNSSLIKTEIDNNEKTELKDYNYLKTKFHETNTNLYNIRLSEIMLDNRSSTKTLLCDNENTNNDIKLNENNYNIEKSNHFSTTKSPPRKKLKFGVDTILGNDVQSDSDTSESSDGEEEQERELKRKVRVRTESSVSSTSLSFDERTLSPSKETSHERNELTANSPPSPANVLLSQLPPYPHSMASSYNMSRYPSYSLSSLSNDYHTNIYNADTNDL
ncbi:unnamed protein product, partial [Didymodactylos carnosus]